MGHWRYRGARDMKVFVLMVHHENKNSEVLGVFSTEEKAEFERVYQMHQDPWKRLTIDPAQGFIVDHIPKAGCCCLA